MKQNKAISWYREWTKCGLGIVMNYLHSFCFADGTELQSNTKLAKRDKCYAAFMFLRNWKVVVETNCKHERPPINVTILRVICGIFIVLEEE